MAIHNMVFILIQKIRIFKHKQIYYNQQIIANKFNLFNNRIIIYNKEWFNH
jgi:hypothetical protein